MTTTVSAPRKWNWLILDLLGTAALMLGAFSVFAPEQAADVGIPAALGWPLIVIGGVATLAAILMFLRQLRAQRTG